MNYDKSGFCVKKLLAEKGSYCILKQKEKLSADIPAKGHISVYEYAIVYVCCAINFIQPNGNLALLQA